MAVFFFKVPSVNRPGVYCCIRVNPDLADTEETGSLDPAGSWPWPDLSPVFYPNEKLLIVNLLIHA